MSVDPLAGKYPFASPYNFVLNTPIQAVDPDGKLVIFVNGFRPSQNPLTKNRSISKNDKYGYWGKMADNFMTRLNDRNALYVDGTAKVFSSANKWWGVNWSRYQSGQKDGEAIIKKIESGEIILQQGESIKLVSHSQGSARAAGISDILTKAGYKVEVNYNISPKQPDDIPVQLKEERTVQYGSDWDIIAPQSEMPGADESVKTPEDAEDGPIDGHLLDNYDWIFDIPEGQNGYVEPRKDVSVEQE